MNILGGLEPGKEDVLFSFVGDALEVLIGVLVTFAVLDVVGFA